MKITKMQWVWIVLGAMILLGMCSNKSQPVSNKNVASKMNATATSVREVEATYTLLVEPTEIAPSVTSTQDAQPTFTVLVEPTEVVITGTAITEASINALDDDTSAAPCKTGQIKGSQNGIYHLPGGRDYKRTKKNVTCFDTIDDAKAAGFVPTANP